MSGQSSTLLKISLTGALVINSAEALPCRQILSHDFKTEMLVWVGFNDAMKTFRGLEIVVEVSF